MVARRTRLVLWWRRTGSMFRLGLFVFGALLVAFGLYLGRPQDDVLYPGSNLLVFFFVNLVVILLLGLVFVVGRNVLKLVFDRQRQIFGSRLRLKLVLSFVGLTLVPTVILFAVAHGLLSSAIQVWFSGPVQTAVSGAVTVARQHLALVRTQAFRNSQRLEQRLKSRELENAQDLRRFLESERTSFAFFSIRIIDAQGTALQEVENAAGDIDDFKEPALDAEALAKALKGEHSILGEEHRANQFVRVYLPFRSGVEVLVTSTRIAPEFVAAMNSVNDANREYGQLRFFKNPLRSSYVVTLSLLTVLILFAAIWVGIFIAREITGSLERLGQGVMAVARGDYGVQMRVQGDDEIASLMRSFNQMTADLKRSTGDAELRQLFIETILVNLVVGVIAVDPKGEVTSINNAARKLFGITLETPAVGSALSSIVSTEHFRELHELICALERDSVKKVIEKELAIESEGREHKIICTVGQIHTRDGELLGTLLLFDDVTGLIQAQHMAAWRDVARRIAHEIKNPLTPIQLSAQRLERLLEDQTDNKSVFECTQAIVENVDSIKRLANEFSKFARMPQAEFALADLNRLVVETVAPFTEAHPEMRFQVITDEKLPNVSMDSEQIRRAIINLVDNAIAALQTGALSEPGKITITTKFEAVEKRVRLEVADNGPGVAKHERGKIFEPYFTTKKGGTGLGLAIVSSVVAEHQGTLRLYDIEPHGARFVVELPLRQAEFTQRRLAGGER